ncbi:uncharacterized protein LOC143819148 [Paroedura picta]|uniref:uncharacterized protein LOC143819148 n=1 Tax=Paroedura picta TaxID=143630 RepID=UPI004055A5C9
MPTVTLLPPQQDPRHNRKCTLPFAVTQQEFVAGYGGRAPAIRVQVAAIGVQATLSTSSHADAPFPGTHRENLATELIASSTTGIYIPPRLRKIVNRQRHRLSPFGYVHDEGCRFCMYTYTDTYCASNYDYLEHSSIRPASELATCKMNTCHLNA